MLVYQIETEVAAAEVQPGQRIHAAGLRTGHQAGGGGRRRHLRGRRAGRAQLLEPGHQLRRPVRAQRHRAPGVRPGHKNSQCEQPARVRDQRGTHSGVLGVGRAVGGRREDLRPAGPAEREQPGLRRTQADAGGHLQVRHLHRGLRERPLVLEERERRSVDRLTVQHDDRQKVQTRLTQQRHHMLHRLHQPPRLLVHHRLLGDETALRLRLRCLHNQYEGLPCMFS